MVRNENPTVQRIIQVLSRTLVVAGAVFFFAADKYLHEVMHMSFLRAEAIGIPGGLVLMVLGAVIGKAGKPQ
jgi:F0F1-type ATP synthase assembly protein I